MTHISPIWLIVITAIPLIKDGSGYALNDYRHCTLKPGQLVFEVLPGSGWDSLRNLEMGRILAFNYSQCSITEDRKYLVPDNFIVIPTKQTRMELASDVYNHYKDYTPLASESVTTRSRSRFAATASFSKEYSQLKKAFIAALSEGSVYEDPEHKKVSVSVGRMVYGSAGGSLISVKIGGVEAEVGVSGVILKKKHGKKIGKVWKKIAKSMRKPPFIGRIVMDHKFYSFTIQRGKPLEFSKEFSDRVEELAHELTAELTKTPSHGDYLAEQLVRHFGTDYIYGLDAGATIAKTDVVNHVYFSKGCAAQSFLTHFNLHDSGSSPCTNVHLYQRYSHFSEITSLGGPFLSTDVNIDHWRKRIPNNLVAIDRKGESLDALFTKSIFPKYPEYLLREMRRRVGAAIKLYYERNTIKGCQNLRSSSFDKNANVHDESMCSGVERYFYFGGSFQLCTILKMPKDGDKEMTEKDFGDPCRELRIGQGSCPGSTEKRKLLERTVTKCRPFCKGGEMTSCPQECVTMRVTTFWCLQYSNYRYYWLFGGMHSIEQLNINPITQGYSCPAGFRSFKFTSPTSIVCVSRIRGNWSPVQFGGLYSCMSGNPAAGDEKTCPRGYTKRLATVEQDCEVYYCGQTKELNGYVVPRISLPPFTNRPIPTRRRLRHNDASMEEVDLGKTQKWIITNGGLRHTANMSLSDVQLDTDRVMIKRFFES